MLEQGRRGRKVLRGEEWGGRAGAGPRATPFLLVGTRRALLPSFVGLLARSLGAWLRAGRFERGRPPELRVRWRTRRFVRCCTSSGRLGEFDGGASTRERRGRRETQILPLEISRSGGVFDELSLAPAPLATSLDNAAPPPERLFSTHLGSSGPTSGVPRVPPHHPCPRRIRRYPAPLSSLENRTLWICKEKHDADGGASGRPGAYWLHPVEHAVSRAASGGGREADLSPTSFTSPSLAPREECDALRAPGRLLLNLTSPLETHWRPFDEAACPPLPGYLPALWSLLYGSETPLPGQYPITETEAYRNMIADPAPPPSLPSLPGAPPPPDPVAFLRRARLAATPPTILILGDSVDRNALVHFCRKDPVLIARNPSWEQGESGAGGFGRRGQACQQDSRRIQRRAQELKSILAELFEQDVSISHYANISSHPPDTEHDRDLTFHGHGPAHEGWDQRGLPHRCEIPFAGAKGGKREVALRVVNAFHYGMDAMDVRFFLSFLLRDLADDLGLRRSSTRRIVRTGTSRASSRTGSNSSSCL